jgi:predicted negative regulator of RcsB-dependent stress response
VHDSYGEALLLSGDTTGAVASYQRALELDSTNTNAVQVLETLRE